IRRGTVTGPIDFNELDDDPGLKPRRGGLAARAMAPADPPYMHSLNPQQSAAVETRDGPLLVLAGAGTGKTRVLTTRLAHLLATGRARPWELLAVTFTHTRARQLR